MEYPRISNWDQEEKGSRAEGIQDKHGPAETSSTFKITIRDAKVAKKTDVSFLN